jgi:hypothetical protein
MPAFERETIPVHELRPEGAARPPAPATRIALDEPLTLYLWDDPGGNFTGHTLLALASTAEAARELLVEDAAGVDATAIHHYRAYRDGRRPGGPLGQYRNLWLQLQADPRQVTRPTALRLRPLAMPGTAHS